MADGRVVLNTVQNVPSRNFPRIQNSEDKFFIAVVQLLINIFVRIERLIYLRDKNLVLCILDSDALKI